MNVLLIGGGAREHALAWKLKQSPELGALYCAPGNAGIFEIATKAAIDIADFDAVAAFCRDRGIGLVVPGPEAPLVAGMADALRARGIAVFGPSRAAAMLEASKAFTKDICAKAGIPTAACAVFADKEAALAHVRAAGAPCVVKADGLAAGKGVSVCHTVAEAEAAIEACFAGAFGAAGAIVVIEEMLCGEEMSFFALCDGTTALPLASAQDYKRAHEGDSGPNTGGMGAVSPAPMLTDALGARIMTTIISPTLAAMAARGAPYQGVLYAGLMITEQGPKLIEYNVRFGDPECQLLMLRLKSDVLPALVAAASGRLGEVVLEWRKEVAITVVMAAKGYPGPCEDGGLIGGVEEAAKMPGIQVFHAGTSRREDGALIAKGGRVLNVAALGHHVQEAQARAYAALSVIDWPGGFYRRDIGWRSLNRKGPA